MINGESPDFDQVREEANLQLAETARNGVDRLCSDLIEITFKLLNDRLSNDKLAIRKAGSEVLPLYVSPNRTDPPEYEGKSTKSLSMLYKRKSLKNGKANEDNQDMIKVYLPWPEGYEYPELIDKDDMPPEMYIEYIPKEGSRELYGRYILQRDEADFPKFRYSVFAYEIDPETREHVIYDAMHSEVIHEGVMERISDDIERAARILRRIGNFDAVPQKTTHVHIENEDVIQLPE